jgi:RHH-type transcriptional regulator, proline utilization regulon repressor / proline dehydrogenase / delta 1-pyrroline-5-carboxylate dehydrogenase
VAETGGINCMIADSSALPEQVVTDIVSSAFNSAGQRCSALRVLYLQSEIAASVLSLLRGHMRELVIGDPMDLSTDVGPVIDAAAADELHNYIAAARAAGRLDFALTPPPLPPGHYVGPCLITIGHIGDVPGEVFGPILHVRTFDIDALGAVCDEINATAYGLTLGIQSRIDHRVDTIVRRVRVGNVYVNRNMIGAMVESQPFGGCGLSGTGPKAGGPHYLLRFATERTLTVNTAAIGGNATLISLTDNDVGCPTDP